MPPFAPCIQNAGLPPQSVARGKPSRSERPEQAAPAIGAPSIGVGVVAEPVVTASVEVIGRAATVEAAVNVAVAMMDLDCTGRDTLGVASAKCEFVAAEKGCGGDADHCNEEFFVPAAAL